MNSTIFCATIWHSQDLFNSYNIYKMLFKHVHFSCLDTLWPQPENEDCLTDFLKNNTILKI